MEGLVRGGTNKDANEERANNWSLSKNVKSKATRDENSSSRVSWRRTKNERRNGSKRLKAKRQTATSKGGGGGKGGKT